MDYITFLAQTERKLNLTMPFLSKELIKSRAEEEWAKFQRKQTPKQVINNKKQKTAPVKKPPRRVSSFREKLNTLSSDFADCETPKANSDALFDTVYNLRPKTKPKAKTDDVYNFSAEESDVIPSTLPPLMSNVGKTKKTSDQKPKRTIKKPQPVKTASKNQNKTRVRFVDDVNEKENRFVPIETVTKVSKIDKMSTKTTKKSVLVPQIDKMSTKPIGKSVIVPQIDKMSTKPIEKSVLVPQIDKMSTKPIEKSVLVPQIDYIITETQLNVDRSDERTKSLNLSSNLNEKQVGLVTGSEDDQKEKHTEPLTFAIEKLVEQLKMPNNGLMNVGGRNNNIYWQITITNKSSPKLTTSRWSTNMEKDTKKCVAQNDVSDILVEQNDYSDGLVDQNDVLVDQNDYSDGSVDQNDVLVDQNDVLVEQNDVLVEQNDALVEQNDVLVEQNDVLVEQNDFSEVSIEQNDFSDVLVEQNDFSADLIEENRFCDERIEITEICRDVFVSERELEDPFREIGAKLEKLDRKSRKIQKIMYRSWVKTDKICDEIDLWLSGLNAKRFDEDKRQRVKIKRKIKVIEPNDENNPNSWKLFDDLDQNGVTSENRTLFTLPENHSVRDFLEDDDIFV